ncbi:hypothetical protein COEREDRAFT_81882 [Coemansia reversa NRRL 1564]|uniref:Uncharacterized protein n=1 Tax=Coemansia reversa (strain ATCC 12441 / NRRL 1564) TaxID=763665 RepID=A0A2G5B951_COERN|nr:hypothetical protein COEREDRAFT_81882 [Coemansia reversa NRRL 1564]|eukprot:PIA15545.1 hypothetical protein COEREDRAFT_81882 [Coemansia reversa NRRL 1564]
MAGQPKGPRLAFDTKPDTGASSHPMVGRTVSNASSHTESSSDSSLGNASAEYNSIEGKNGMGQNMTRTSGIGISGGRRFELRSSCPDSRLRSHKMQPPRNSDGRSNAHYQLSCDKKANRNSSMSVDSADNVLEDSRRFIQENYHCSFCTIEQPTFEKLLGHIEVEHPWYDLRVHRKIR